MVQLDWKRILALSPEGMTEQDKDELCETVTWYLPDHNTDRKNLIHFVRVTQEILKFKSHQVESLMNELDELAAKQGEEEARDRQDFIDEIDRLKEQLEYHKRLDQESGRPIFGSGDEIKSEVVRLEMQIEEVLMELQEREKELMKEKIEVENYASQVATLQREKEDLKRELTALQEESQERMNGKSIQDSPEFGPEKQEELTDLIRQKNKHITQLLDDIENLEKQNLTFKTKLTNVCDELSDATSHINEMTMHLSQMKHINDELSKKLADAEERNNSLMSQIEELSEEKEKHDKQLDKFNETFNSKVQEWKEILEAKEMEICKAEEEIRRLLASTSTKYPEFVDLEVNKKVAEQEEQIVDLKNELLRATHEINSCTEMIENFKEKQTQLKFTDTDQFRGQILVYEERIRHLEEKLRYAEEDAHTKAEEISEIVIQLREYEMGEFGLAEAMNRIKQLEKSLEKRDLQIEKLVHSCNNMEIEFENVEEQNMALRERLGISASEEIDTTNVKLRFRKDLEVIENLKFQLDKREEELIKAKLKYRKLIKFIKLNRRASEGSISSSEESKEGKPSVETVQKYMEEKANMEKRLLSIIKENDALRKGMHEILESIQKQDAAGTVEIQSNCLERLLEALDSRHVSGWYHPAMRLQAQLKSIEGKNEELRNQIRSIRKEERSRSTELEDANLKIRNLENQLFIMRSPRDDTGSKTKTPESELEDVDMGSTDKQSITNAEQEQRVIALETEVLELKLELNKAKAETEKVQSLNAAEKEELSSRIMGLEKQVSSMEGHVDGQIVESTKLQSRVSVQERQITLLKLQNEKEKEDNERLYKEKMEQEEKLFQEILRLQSHKVEYIMRIEKLEKELLQSVPKSEMNGICNELAEVKVKYQDAVALTVARYEDNSVERLEEEVKLVQREKSEVLDELRSVKEKLTLALTGELAPESASEMSIMAEKLAASEVRELNEKQKSAHLEKINLMLRSELQDLEAYNKEMSELLAELKDIKRKYEESERRVTNPTDNTEEECNKLREKVDGLEKKLRIAESDRENFRELFEISRGQFRYRDSYRDKDKQRINSLNEQVLLLQSAADEKAIVARLSHELLTCQLSSAELTKEKTDLEDRVAKLLSKNLFLEAKIDEAREVNFEVKRKNLAQCENLHRTISDLRKLLGTFTLFPGAERIQKMKKRLNIVQAEERRRLKELKNEAEELLLKKQELAVKMEGADALIAAYKGDSRQLMAWYNKGTNLRLEEARCRRQNQFLSGELEQLEKYIKKMDDEIIALEELNLSREKEWERKQILWEQSQLEMFELLKEKGIERVKIAKSVQDEATETVTPDESAEGIKKMVKDQAETIKKYETEMQKSEAEIKQLKKDLSEKMSAEYLETRIEKKTHEEVMMKDVNDEAEKAALKVTVQSLQNIIRQKEETIFKYQELLKEGRDEFSKSSGKFQEELRMLHDALTKQSKAYIKLKNSLDSGHQMKDGLPMIFEKYLTKIQELEDDLAECQMTLSSVNRQLMATHQEKEKWQKLAEERMSLENDLRLRLEADYRKELENQKAEIESYQLEIERLKRFTETVRNDGSGDHHKVSDDADIQEKEVNYESDSTKKKEQDWSEKGKERIKTLERQLKFARDESARLREQVRLLQVQKSKRPKTASSMTSRSGSESKSSLKEDSLQSKVKTLEELLKIAKEREQDLIENNQRRIKSAEEVARWGEKKKSQQTIQNLTSKLKEKEAEIEILKSKNENFRNMIHKIEKDRDILEVQLKAARDGPSSLTARLDKLMSEKSQLEKEIGELKEKLGMQQRHESGIGAAVLYDKLENQERKLAALELASRGRPAIVEELQKLQNSYTNLEKANLRLESENLSLRLQMEKEKAIMVQLIERNGELEKMLMVAEEESEIRQIESDRTISSLNEKIGKVSESRRNCKNMHSSRLATCPEKLRKDHVKLKEDYKTLRAKYLEQIDKNRDLEEEVKKCRYQIHLLEEKDLADSIAKTNSLQLTSQLSQELIQVKAQLAHKTQLLNRVKVLLTKAAAKEKALTEKVSALQGLVPA